MSAPSAGEQQLAARMMALEAENKELRAQVLASQHTPPLKAGLLYKHRPRARLLSAEWEPRYVTVTPGMMVGSGWTGGLPSSPTAAAAAAASGVPTTSAGFLAYWRHADDAASNAPLGRLDLGGCHVILEESTQRRLHPVAVVAADGGYFESCEPSSTKLRPLIRFAATDAANAASWAQALVEAGCARGPPPRPVATATAATAAATRTNSGELSPRDGGNDTSNDGGATPLSPSSTAATTPVSRGRGSGGGGALGAFFLQRQQQYPRTQSAVDYTSDSEAASDTPTSSAGGGGGGGAGTAAAVRRHHPLATFVPPPAAAFAARAPAAGMTPEEAAAAADAAAMRGAAAAALGRRLSTTTGGTSKGNKSSGKKPYDDSPSALVHASPRQSVLSVRALVRGDNSGLRNLMTIIVVLANFRLVLENLIKYGVLVSPVMWARVLYPGTDLYMCACWPWMALCLAAPLFVEKLAARRVLGDAERRPPLAAVLSGARAARLAAAAAAAKKRNDGGGATSSDDGGTATTSTSAIRRRFPTTAVEAARAAASAPPRPVDLRRAQRIAAAATDFWAAVGHAAAAAAALVVPCWVVWVRAPALSSPVPGFVLVMCAIVAAMKVASFGHCNADLRARAREVAREKKSSASSAAAAALRRQPRGDPAAAIVENDGGGGAGGPPGTPGRSNDPQRLSAGGEGTTRRSRFNAGASSSGDERHRGRALTGNAAPAVWPGRSGRGEGLAPVLTTTAELTEEEAEEEAARAAAARAKENSDIDDSSSDSSYPTYPANLTVGNLAYFVAAPTLVYQTGYPRSPGTRASTRRLLWCSFKLSVAAALQAAIWEQYVMPTIRNSVAAVKARSPAGVAERVLKLALPSTYSWVVMFVTLFDCYLTLLAEATRFADRAFFLDWWNARTVGQYWRTWNLPVHRFLLRHVFNPLRRRGVGRLTAMTLVFAVSAALHEVAVAVPLHLFRPPWKLYAFWGVLLQVPLVMLTEPLAASGAGNYVFWVSFCAVGQPIGMIMYFFDWVSAKEKLG